MSLLIYLRRSFNHEFKSCDRNVRAGWINQIRFVREFGNPFHAIWSTVKKKVFLLVGTDFL